MGKAMDTNTGESPGYQTEPALIAWKLTYSEEVRGLWIPTGVKHMEQWMDGVQGKSRSDFQRVRGDRVAVYDRCSLWREWNNIFFSFNIISDTPQNVYK